MIVDRDSLNVRPIADRLLRDAVSDPSLTRGEVEREEGTDIPSEIEIKAVAGHRSTYPLSWSNELALHVIELKTSAPVREVTGLLAADFQAHVRAINRLLSPRGAMLLGTGMHPWMDPNREKQLWPHGRKEIYEAFDRIFDCRGHGWANLQSMHINLPFANDEEFGRLHAAIRVLLPILPALSASSPFMDGRSTGTLDNRLAVYKANARNVPSVSGKVIPEPVFTRDDYEREIFGTIYREIAAHERNAGVEPGLLQHEWLNSRGAIARFDRNAIEIRVLDVQECPAADIAIAENVIGTLKKLVSEEWSTYEEQKRWGVAPLATILDRCISDAEGAKLDLAEGYTSLFPKGARGARTTAELWANIVSELKVPSAFGSPAPRAPLPSLATRMTHRVGSSSPAPNVSTVPGDGEHSLRSCTAELAECLAQGHLFHA